MQECQTGVKRMRTDPLEEANSIAKLAKTYDRKVQETRSAKGIAVKTSEDDENCEITPIGSTSHAPENAFRIKPNYKEAPTLTLEELLPERFRKAGHETCLLYTSPSPRD